MNEVRVNGVISEWNQSERINMLDILTARRSDGFQMRRNSRFQNSRLLFRAGIGYGLDPVMTDATLPAPSNVTRPGVGCSYGVGQNTETGDRRPDSSKNIRTLRMSSFPPRKRPKSLAFRTLSLRGPRPETTGVTYYQYRWYDPLTGRWPSRDPIVERGGLNLYGMCRSRPIGKVDGLGLAEVDCKACNDCKDAKGEMTKDISPEIDARLKAYKTSKEMYQGEGVNKPRTMPPPMAIIEDWADNLPSTNHSKPGKSKYAGTRIDPGFGLPSFLNGCANVCGKCIGTDKLGHMLQQGYEYQQLDDKYGAGTGEIYGKWTEGEGKKEDYSKEDQKKFELYGIPFGGYGLIASGIISKGDQEANKQGLKLYNDLRDGKFKTICDYVNTGMMIE